MSPLSHFHLLLFSVYLESITARVVYHLSIFTFKLCIQRADEQDSQVEIDAKIAAGYFGGAKDVKAEDLHLTVGRAWEDLEH